MNPEQQREIYSKWKELEKECHIEAQIIVPGRPYKVNIIVPEKRTVLSKYRLWVRAYCFDLLDVNERFEMRKYGNENDIKCKCTTPDCAKCLLVNCQDDDCYYHPIRKKEGFRLMYSNKK